MLFFVKRKERPKMIETAIPDKNTLIGIFLFHTPYEEIAKYLKSLKN